MKDNKTLTIDELNQMFSEGEGLDKDLFSEMRSNILLSSGDHYAKSNSKWWNRVRESKQLSQDQKVRITKNHTGKVVKTHVNAITSMAPGVLPTPADSKSLQSLKAAELNKAVWDHAKQKHRLKSKISQWAKDFVELGECLTKVYWDPQAGRFLGYEQEIDETGQAVFDEMGQPQSSGKAIFTGDLVFERLFAFNLIRPAEAKSLAEAPWLALRKMVSMKELKALVGDDEDKLDMIHETEDDTFLVFDGVKGKYTKTKNQTEVREYYVKPCYDHPEGYFYITTQAGILFEGPLPFGVYPIIHEGYDEVITTPRFRSIIKQIRPSQAVINLCASKMVEHMTSGIGDDKVILQNGSKMTSGPHLPGIRSYMVNGMGPTIMSGRTGDQYLAPLQAAIQELYQIGNVAEEMEEKDVVADPLANLYRSLRDKKKFSFYAEKFERFLAQVCETYLDLARHYFDENMLVPAIGKSEYINIAEFKTTDPLCYKINIEPLSDDLSTLLGRHLTYMNVLQYVGKNLSPDAIGTIIKNMPFADADEAFQDLTIDADTATNIILALDRNEMPNPSKQDNGTYILKRLTSRQKMSDYRLLPPQAQQNYEQIISYYEQIEAQKAQEIKQAQSEFIPASGALIKCDYYIKDPTNPGRSVRAVLPAEAVDWLIKQLSTQGSAQESLNGQTTGTQADISKMLMQLNGENPNQAVPGSPQQQQMMQAVPGGMAR